MIPIVADDPTTKMMSPPTPAAAQVNDAMTIQQPREADTDGLPMQSDHPSVDHVASEAGLTSVAPLQSFATASEASVPSEAGPVVFPQPVMHSTQQSLAGRGHFTDMLNMLRFGSAHDPV